MKLNQKNNRNKHRIIFVVMVLLFCLIGGYVAYTAFQNNSQPDANVITDNLIDQVADENKPNREKVIHFAAMGDMLAHDTIIANAKTDSGYDFGKFFTNIKASYSEADIVFCNQEGLSSGSSFGISGYPSFNAPTEFASDLNSKAGCNLINLANNHIGDKGVGATNTTIDLWNSLKTYGVSGANKSEIDQEEVDIFELNGIKIGYVSFADFNNNNSTPGYSVNIYHNEALLMRLIKQATDNSDVVIVSMHWGIEDSNEVSTDQQAQANLLNVLGVDVIIGTGPHVLQKMQIIEGPGGHKTVVWYSLGNMLSSQLNISQLIGGIAKFDIEKTDAGDIFIKNNEFIPTYMHYEWSASDAAAGNLLTRKNAMIYLLDSAAEPLSKSLFNTTVSTQKQYVKDILGSEITIK